VRHRRTWQRQNRHAVLSPKWDQSACSQNSLTSPLPRTFPATPPSNSHFENFSHGKKLKNNGMASSILYIVYFFIHILPAYYRFGMLFF
jgi:hypothetical protein